MVRRFETWDAALWFAEFATARTARRHRVTRQAGPMGLPLWTVVPA